MTIVIANVCITVASLGSLSKPSFGIFFCVGKVRKVNQRSLIQVSWSKPPEGWFKLNTDGASGGNPSKAGAGGLIRDSSGHWVKGFVRSIGFATSVTAEFWALRDGLKLALSEGIQNLIVELDARVVVDLINSNVDSVKPYSPLLCDCRCLLRRFPRVQVKHVYREGNRCADALARWG
nr:putative ribonuclease h protein [Quercus suber]